LTLNLWPRASEFGGPVKLIGCDPNIKAAAGTGPANEALAIEGGYDYSFVEGTGHLLQVEKTAGMCSANRRVSRTAWASINRIVVFRASY